jgi:hypothetical protein
VPNAATRIPKPTTPVAKPITTIPFREIKTVIRVRTIKKPGAIAKLRAVAMRIGRGLAA